ncbi:MAG: hypothetical protein ACK4NR_09345 [Micavibrio sp.]
MNRERYKKMTAITIPLITYPEPTYRRAWRFFTPLARAAIGTAVLTLTIWGIV